MESIPDISLWNTNKLINIYNLFKNCKKIEFIPDISNWNLEKVNNLQSIFEGCHNIKSLPDINNWNIKNIKSMRYLFKDCKKLEYIPDISHWFILKDNDILGILDGCNSLKKTNDKVIWMNWEGKKIVYDIIKNKKLPEKNILEKLKKEVKYLIGGEKLVHSYLCNSWKNEFQNNDFVLNNLYKLADEIVYEKLK